MVAAGSHNIPHYKRINSLSERKQHQRDWRTTKATRLKSKWVKLNLRVWRTGEVHKTIAQLREKIVQIYPKTMYNVMSHPWNDPARLWSKITMDIQGIRVRNYHWHSSFFFLQHWLFTHHHFYWSCVLHFYLLWNKINGISQHVSQLYGLKFLSRSGDYWRRYETIYTCTLIRFVKCK